MKRIDLDMAYIQIHLHRRTVQRFNYSFTYQHWVKEREWWWTSISLQRFFLFNYSRIDVTRVTKEYQCSLSNSRWSLIDWISSLYNQSEVLYVDSMLWTSHNRFHIIHTNACLVLDVNYCQIVLILGISRSTYWWNSFVCFFDDYFCFEIEDR